MNIDIQNRYGFLRPNDVIKVKVTASGGTDEDIEKGLFFVKALPLHPDFNVSLSLPHFLQIDLLEQ